MFYDSEEVQELVAKQQGETEARARQTYRVIDALDREQTEVVYLTSKLNHVYDVNPLDGRTPQEALEAQDDA